VDPWGNAFEYQVDENRDGVIPEPDTGDSLRAGVIAWSAGPDGDYDTWEDNIKGWE